MLTTSKPFAVAMQPKCDLAALDVPHNHNVIARSRGKPPVVCGEVHGTNRACVTLQRVHDLVRLGAPDDG